MTYHHFRFDTSGFILEHYVDGDLVDSSHVTNRSKASPDNLHIWGKCRRTSLFYIIIRRSGPLLIIYLQGPIYLQPSYSRNADIPGFCYLQGRCVYVTGVVVNRHNTTN